MINTKTLLAGLLLGAATCIPAYACTGAKQAAMGYAGITVANNTHATYWNPAMLATMKGKNISITKNIDTSNRIRYDRIIGITDSNGQNGIGLQVMDSEVDFHVKGNRYQENMRWLKLGYGRVIRRGEHSTLSIGAGITYKTKHNIDTAAPGYLPFPNPNSHTNGLDLELSIFNENKINDTDTLRWGMLLRRWKDSHQGNGFNIRPGISYSRKNTTLSLSFYHAGLLFAKQYRGKRKEYGPRIGLEHIVNLSKDSHLALRAGIDGSMELDMPTYGIGFQKKDFGIDLAYIKYEWPTGPKSDVITIEFSKRFGK